MTNKEAYKYGEILGALIAFENVYAQGEQQKEMIQNTIAEMSELFDSLNRGSQTQEINANLKSIIK